MRNNKIFKAIAIAAPVLLSANLLADDIIATAIFTTVADVTVTENTAVTFGASVIPIAGRQCVLSFTATTTAPTVAGVTAAATIAGDGCDNAATDALPGLYPVTGAPSASILITTAISDVTDTDKTFTAEGVFHNGGGLTPAVDTTAVANVTLSAAGLGLIVMGGQLDINIDLPFSSAETASYDLEVTY